MVLKAVKMVKGRCPKCDAWVVADDHDCKHPPCWRCGLKHHPDSMCPQQSALPPESLLIWKRYSAWYDAERKRTGQSPSSLVMPVGWRLQAAVAPKEEPAIVAMPMVRLEPTDPPEDPRPWLAAGMSRSAWYRRQQAQKRGQTEESMP
jgi:hypothetical protein